jgi:hypothetical protein
MAEATSAALAGLIGANGWGCGSAEYHVDLQYSPLNVPSSHYCGRP